MKYSQRIETILKESRPFVKKDFTELMSFNFFNSLDQTENSVSIYTTILESQTKESCLSNFYVETNVKGLLKGFLLAYEKLVLKTPISQITQINLREIESYLRDNNDKPCYEISDVEVEKKVKTSLEDIFSYLEKIQSTVFNIMEMKNPLVCLCTKSDYKTVENLIIDNNLSNINEITKISKIGSFCGKCKTSGLNKKRKYFLDRIIDSTLKRRSINKKIPCDSSNENLLHQQIIFKDYIFSELSKIQKIKLINEIINNGFRQFVQKDGGDLKLKDVEGHLIIFSFQGQCLSCKSLEKGTLMALQSLLYDSFQDKDINVIIED